MTPEDLERLVTQLRTEGVTAEKAKSDARVQALKPFDRFALLFALRVREFFSGALGGLTGLAQELRPKPLSTWEGDHRYTSLPVYKRIYVLALGRPTALVLLACAVLAFQFASLSSSTVTELAGNDVATTAQPSVGLNVAHRCAENIELLRSDLLAMLRKTPSMPPYAKIYAASKEKYEELLELQSRGAYRSCVDESDRVLGITSKYGDR